MNCYDVREKVEPYLDMGLPEAEAQSLKEHLEHCAECHQEVETIRKIDSLVKMDLFEPPPREYWKKLPARVTCRLGLRPHEPRLVGIFDSVRGMLAFPSAKWAGAVAVAALTMFVLMRRDDRQEVVSVPDPVTSEHIGEDSSPKPGSTVEEESIRVPVQPQPVSASEMASNGLTSDGNTGRQIESDLAVSTRGKVSAASIDAGISSDLALTFDFQQAILARSIVEKVQTKDIGVGVLEFNRALFPNAGSSFRLGLVQSDNIADDKDDETNARTFTFARGGHGSTSRSAQSRSRADTESASQSDESGASDFFQTLLIVEDTKKLSEKRNIWLSYVGRENNPTYRSLGIYRLADVCYRIADESGDEELAMKAMKLYVKYEKTLKSLMGIEAYDTKVSHIQGLWETN